MLNKVPCVPGMASNLISCGKLCLERYACHFGSRRCNAVQAGTIMLEGLHENGVYPRCVEVIMAHQGAMDMDSDPDCDHDKTVDCCNTRVVSSEQRSNAEDKHKSNMASDLRLKYFIPNEQLWNARMGHSNV